MNKKTEIYLYMAWLTALLSMLGSLFFSEVMKLPPCVLCWYQRICMYPMAVILLIGMLKKDKNITVYALPFSIIGLVIAIYHNLLYYKVLPESIAPCVNGVSCTTKLIELFGFVTIPLLSLLAFLAITVCLALVHKMNSGKR